MSFYYLPSSSIHPIRCECEDLRNSDQDNLDDHTAENTRTLDRWAPIQFEPLTRYTIPFALSTHASTHRWPIGNCSFLDVLLDIGNEED